MPAMYPEQLRSLREQNPNLQYDFRGNIMGVSPAYAASSIANDIRGIMNNYQQPNAWDFGPTRADFQNSGDFIGPLQPQWWDPNGELAQRGLGALVAGQDLRPRPAARPQNPYAPRQRTFDQSSDGLPGVAESPDELSDILLQTNQMPIMQQARQAARQAVPYMGAPYPFSHDDGSGEYVPSSYPARPYGSNADELWPRIQADPGYNPQSSPRGW